MGMFKDMKDMVGVVRSDELKELKKKADAQPKVSMLDGVKMANQAMDQAQEMQAAMASAPTRWQAGKVWPVRVDPSDRSKVIVG